MKELIEQYLEAKTLEQKTKEARLKIETELFSAFNFTNPEGTKTEIFPPYKLSITNNLRRTIDIDKYNSYSWEAEYLFIQMRPEIDMKKLRIAEKLYPKMVANCVTVKPQKPTIKIQRL